MDSHRFDTLARSLATAGTRRRLMLLFAALPLIGTLAGVHDDETVARARQGQQRGRTGGAHAEKKKKKKKKKHRCTPQCQRKICGSDGCGGSCGTCDPGQVCTGGRCASNCPEGHKVCNGACLPSNQCCTTRDCPAATPDCCGGVCLKCSGDRSCINGRCRLNCAYGASACATPTTVCGDNIVTCGGNPSCWAMPTTSECCACSTPPGRSHRACTSSSDCVAAATCNISGPFSGTCNGDQGIQCSNDNDCASLRVCREGACGGQICTTDADCEEALGLGTVCISGAALPCTANGANICWTLCTGA